jgi:hypothetical protein
MSRWRLSPVLAVVVMVAALLAACGSSAKKTPPTTTTGAPVTTSSPSLSSPALTASFRGVTATSIKIGMVFIDYSCIKQFVNFNQGNERDIAQTLIDDLNAHGGILGRKVVAV